MAPRRRPRHFRRRHSLLSLFPKLLDLHRHLVHRRNPRPNPLPPRPPRRHILLVLVLVLVLDPFPIIHHPPSILTCASPFLRRAPPRTRPHRRSLQPPSPHYEPLPLLGNHHHLVLPPRRILHPPLGRGRPAS